jgi:hypothetical protein
MMQHDLPAPYNINKTRIMPELLVRAARWLLPALLVWVCLSVCPTYLQADANESKSLSFLKFATGMVTAYAIHEVGHVVAAGVTGTDLEWQVGTYNQPIGFRENADNDSNGRLIYSAGLVAQSICSEVILQSDSIDKNDSFVRGMMAWNIINPILYAVDYWWIRRSNQEDDHTYQGALEGFEHYSDDTSANFFAAGMAIRAASQGYRYIQTQTWAPDWMKSDKVGLSFNAPPGKSIEVCIQVHF